MSFLNFFTDYFYGKPGKKDFTEADLPETRLQLFREVLNVRKGGMVGLNLFYILFWLPAIAWTFLNLVQLFLAPENDPAALGAYLSSILSSYLLVLVPLVAVTGPFNMGVSYVMRNWARDEHSFVLADFKSALKDNWKQGLLYGLISGLVPFLAWTGLRFYLSMSQSSLLFLLPMAVVLLVSLLWWLSSPLLPTMIVTYRLGFGTMLKNAVLMTLLNLPLSIGMRLLTLAVPILMFLATMLFPTALNWITAAAAALYAVFLPAFNKLICASHANALCEKYLNPKIEGARTNIGLRPRPETKE